MKLASKFTVGIPTGLNVGIHAPLGYCWRLIKTYALKPEFLLCVILIFSMLFYLQVVDVWSRVLFDKIQYTLGRTTSKVLSKKIKP